MENLLDATEVASLLKISKRKFEAMIKEGTAPVFMRLGGLRRWRLQDVNAWADLQIRRESGGSCIDAELKNDAQSSLVNSIHHVTLPH